MGYRAPTIFPGLGVGFATVWDHLDALNRGWLDALGLKNYRTGTPLMLHPLSVILTLGTWNLAPVHKAWGPSRTLCACARFQAPKIGPISKSSDGLGQPMAPYHLKT